MAFNLDDLAKQMLNGMKNVREASGAAPKPIPTLDETSRIQQRIDSRKADIADSIDQVVNRTNLNEAATNYFNVGDTGRDNMMNNRRNEKQFINDMTARGYSKSEVKDFVKDYKNNNGNPVKAIPNKNDIDKFVDPNYRMTKYEEDNAKQLVDDYFKPGTKAYKLLKMSSSNANQAAKIRKEMTEAERNEYDKMAALKNKTSNLASYTFGALNIVPFEDTAMNKMSEWMGGNPEYNYSAMKNSAKVQNPLAYIAGDMTSKLAAYNVLGNAIEGVPALGEATNALGKDMAFGNEIAGKAIGNILRGNMADLALDTIPTEIENYKNGMRGGDLVKDAIGNMALNTLFNGVGEVPSLIKELNLKKILDAQNATNANYTKQIEDLATDVGIGSNSVPDSEINTYETMLRRIATENKLKAEFTARTGIELSDSVEDNIQTINNYLLDNMPAPVAQIAENDIEGEKQAIRESINNYRNNNLKPNEHIYMGKTPSYLSDMGNTDLDLGIRQKKFRDATLPKSNSEHHHGLTDEQVVGFAEDKNSPIAVFKAEDRPDIPVIVGDRVDNENAPIISALDIDEGNINRLSRDNQVRSIYGKDNVGYQLDRARKSNNMLFENKEKVDKLIADADLQSSAQANNINLLNHNISQNGEIVNNPEMSRISESPALIANNRRQASDELDEMLGNVSHYSGNLDNDARFSQEFIELDRLAQLVERVKNNPAYFETGQKEVQLSYDSPWSVIKADDGSNILEAQNGLGLNTVNIKDQDALIDYFRKQYNSFFEPKETWVNEDIGINPNTVLEDEIDDIAKETDEIVNGNNALKPQEDYNIIEETVDPGVNPNSVVDTTNMKERGLSKRIRGWDMAGNEMPMKVADVPDEVVSDFIDNPDFYAQLKNVDTLAKAERIYNNPDVDTETAFRTLLERHDPASLPLGKKIADDYSAAGNHEMAAQIYRDMGEQLTSSGQFSQAAVLMMTKNDPLSAMLYAEKQIDKMNIAGRAKYGKKWKDFQLTEDEIKAFGDIKPNDEEAIKALYDQIGTRLGKEYPSTMTDKLLELRRVGMLLNPRTHTRNFLANVPMIPMRWMADRVEAVGQNISHLINPNVQVTQSLAGSGIKGRKLAKKAFESDAVQNMIKGTSGKYEEGVKSALMNNKQVFKGTALEKWLDNVSGKAFNKAAEVLNSSKRIDGGIQALNSKLYGKEGVQSTLETLRNTTYKLLDLGDSPFVKENFVERLGSYINAQGIKNIDEIPPEAIQTALDAAMKATYKDNSWAVQMLSGLRGGIEKVPGIGKFMGQGAIPFLQAPGNIAARMVDYSAINGVKGIGDIIAGATKNNAKQVTEGIEEFAKGATGSSMVLLGMKLRESGLITGDYSEDPDQKAQQKRDGFRPFALHIGDKYFAYDWAQPAAEPMIIGTLLQETIENSDKYDSELLKALGYEGTDAGKAIGALKAGGKASVNSWFNASPLQGLSELMSGNSNGETDIAQNVWDTTISDFAGSFIPSAVNATAKTMDTTQRNTYDPSNKVKSFLYQQQAKIPGLSDKLPAKYDTWGEEMKYADSNLESGLQRYLIPGEYGVDKHDEIDDEINRLFESTGNNAVFAPKASYSVGDMKLNNEQNSLYQRDMGQRNRELVEEFIDSDYYQSLSDEDRAEVLKNMYNVSRAITERDNFDRKISDNSSYKDAIEVYDRNGAAGLIDYYEDKAHKKEAKDTMGTSAEWAMELYDSNDKSRLNKYKDAQKVAKKFGYDSLSEEEFLQFEKYGQDKLEQTLYYKESADKLGVSNNEMYRELVDNNVDPKYIKQAYNDITSMQCGVDEYDRPKYLDFDKTAVDIYYNYGEQGIQNYADIKSMGGNKDTYNSFMLYSARQPEYSNQIPALDPQQFMAQVDSIEQSYYKRNPDADGKPNGNISMKELLDYMTVNNFSQDLAQKYWNSFFDNGYTVSLTKKGKYHYTNPNKKKKK